MNGDDALVRISQESSCNIRLMGESSAVGCGREDLDLIWPLTQDVISRFQGHGVFVLGRSFEGYGVITGERLQTAEERLDSPFDGDSLIHTSADCRQGRLAVLGDAA